MAGGQKHWRKRTIRCESELDGISLQWELISEPSWSNSGDGYKGLCILVRVASDARRELIIEYPFPTGKDGRKLPVPQRPAVSVKKVEASILAAQAAGWDPNSRGRTFVFLDSGSSG